MQPTDTVPRPHEVAEEFLLTALKDGPVASTEIVSLAEAQGISKSTLDRAKQKLGVMSYQHEKHWYWKLPSSSPDSQTPKDFQFKDGIWCEAIGEVAI